MAMLAITTADVLQVLQPQWRERTETLMRVRNRLELIWDWAKVMGYCGGGENPARWRGHLDKLLAKDARKPTEHFAAVDYKAVPALVQALRQSASAAADALEFAIHSALRYDALSGIGFDEIDPVERVLTVPASRMKGKKGARRSFRVPLTEPMLAILERRRALRLGRYVFTAGRADQPMACLAGRVVSRHSLSHTPRGRLDQRQVRQGLAQFARALRLPGPRLLGHLQPRRGARAGTQMPPDARRGPRPDRGAHRRAGHPGGNAAVGLKAFPLGRRAIHPLFKLARACHRRRTAYRRSGVTRDNFGHRSRYWLREEPLSRAARISGLSRQDDGYRRHRLP
jgi:hypothetical protein